MKKISIIFAFVLLSVITAAAQVQTPFTYSATNPSPNAPGGNCVTSTAPVYNYLSGTYWYCVPNTAPPTNLGTWTSYTFPNAVLAGNGSGQLANATAAQIATAGSFPTSAAVVATNSSGVPVAATTTGSGTTAVLATGPTLTNPVIIGPAPVACGATCSPTAGQLILLNQAAGSTVTLPTSAGTGNVIRMRITVATTSASEKVLLTTTSDAIIGTAIGENAGTAKIFVGNASTYHSLQMPFAGSQPSGGFIGDAIVCTDIAAGTWACDVQYQAGTIPTTPYSASTS